MTVECDVVLPASVVRALHQTVFFDRQADRDDKPRVMVQLPVPGVLAWIAGDPKGEEAALRKGFPDLTADQMKVATSALSEMLREHIRTQRAQRRRASSWVANW